MTKHEVVIIGASLAGAACVRELARLGIDAVAFERGRFPRDKVCGGFLSPGGAACLERLGVLDEAHTAGAVQVTSARIRAGSAEVEIPFDRPGLGISRRALDEIVARHPSIRQRCDVRTVWKEKNEFIVTGATFEVACAVVIDAAGKLSRFTRRKAIEQFGIQYFESGGRGRVMDFWFFADGYGGAVSVEGGRSNFCFLINKETLPRYLGKPGCLVTGPVGYERIQGEYIAIGDAAGMVDPFCGEGMRHALDTGLLAAGIVGRGLRAGRGYDEMRQHYEYEWRRRWSRKRAVAAALRAVLRRPRIFAAGIRAGSKPILRQLWA